MSRKRSRKTLSGLLWKQLTSVRLTVAVLLTIAAAAVIGTLIPQNQPPDYYREYFGERLYPVMARLDLPDMYHSLWFQTLILLLAANIIACSLDRIKGVLKIVFEKKPTWSPSAFGRSSAAEAVIIDAPVSALRGPCRDFFNRKFSRIDEQETDEGVFLFAENGRFSRLGVYVVHLSVLLLLAGALIGSLFGFDGYINLPEGESTNHIFLSGSDKKHDLGFTLRCDAFDVSFYETGEPKEYRSDLAILENEREIIKKYIRVNQPLRFRGVNIFQSSYGTASARDIAVTFTSRKSGMEYQRTINIGEPVTIPEGLGVFTAERFLSNYLFQGGHNIGETLIGTLEQGEHREMVALPLRFAAFDKMRQGDVIIAVTGLERVYFTGLQVNKDPGVPLVYAGFLLIIAGIYVTFFLSHRKWCVRLTATGDKTEVTVFFKANKNQPAARQKAQAMTKKLARLKATV
ncbi:MAG: cytochrome c biogenesis protein ResB [Thermodesulfobacteriota bacterium]